MIIRESCAALDMDRQEGLPRGENQKGRRRGKRKKESAAHASPSQKITPPKTSPSSKLPLPHYYNGWWSATGKNTHAEEDTNVVTTICTVVSSAVTCVQVKPQKQMSFPRLSELAMDQRSKFGCPEISHTYLLCSEAWIRTFMSSPSDPMSRKSP